MTDYASRFLTICCGHPCCGARKDCDEIPASHSITSSARVSRKGGVKQLLGSRGACPLKMGDGATAAFSRLFRRPASRRAFINTAFETPLAHSMPTNRHSEPGMALVFLDGRPSTIWPALTQARRSHRAQQAPRRRSTLAFVKILVTVVDRLARPRLYR